MKKLILLMIVCLTTMIVSAQTDSTKAKITGYTSVGFSTTNGNDFKAASYVAVETGICYKSFAIGGIFGRGNLVGIGKKTDGLSDYYYEIKTTGYYPIGSDLTGSLLFGWGGYFNSTHRLIEYGVGMTYNVGKIGYGVMYSNWDAVNYITPNITFNF